MKAEAKVEVKAKAEVQDRRRMTDDRRPRTVNQELRTKTRD
jgi:hypothetical protein